MHAKLTDQGDDTFELPVARVVATLETITEEIDEHTVKVSNLTAECRALVGWYDFIEEMVDSVYDKGAPTDTLNGFRVDRTYPAKELKDTDTLRTMRLGDVGRMAEAVRDGGMIHQPSGDSVQNWDTRVERRASVGTMNHKSSGRRSGYKAFNREGIPVAFTPAKWNQYVDALADHVEDTEMNAIAHAEALMALTDSREIVDYDITTGWPANPVET